MVLVCNLHETSSSTESSAKAWLHSLLYYTVQNRVHVITGHEHLEAEYSYRPTLSLNSALDAGGRPTPRPKLFTPGKEARYLQYRRLWVHRAVLGGCSKTRLSIYGPSSPQTVAIPNKLFRPVYSTAVTTAKMGNIRISKVNGFIGTSLMQIV